MFYVLFIALCYFCILCTVMDSVQLLSVTVFSLLMLISLSLNVPRYEAWPPVNLVSLFLPFISSITYLLYL